MDNSNNNSKNPKTNMEDDTIKNYDLNPETTEHLKLFNPTFKKKKGPPKKVTIIDPQEFKNPQKTIDSIENNNMGHEILPDLRNMTVSGIKSMIDNVSSEITDPIFENYSDNMTEKETNTFYSSVEVLLRELKFQEKFITPNTVGFSLNSNRHTGKPFDLQNYSPIKEELTPAEYENYIAAKEEIERKAKLIEIELEKEAAFQQKRRKIEFEIEQEKRKEKIRIQNEKAIEHDRKIREELRLKKKQMEAVRQEKIRVEQEKKEAQERALEEKKQAMEAAYKSYLEMEEANKAKEELRKAQIIAQKKKIIEKQRENEMKRIENIKKSIAEIRKAREEHQKAENERKQAEKEEQKKRMEEILANRKAELAKKKIMEEQEQRTKLEEEYAKKVKEAYEKEEEFRKKKEAIREFQEQLKEAQEQREIEIKKQQEAERLHKEQREKEEEKRKEDLKKAYEEAKLKQKKIADEQLKQYREFIETHRKKINEDRDIVDKEDAEAPNAMEIQIRQTSEPTTTDFHGLTASEMTNILSVFNFEFYRNQYSDAEGLSISETLKNYLTVGKKENRIISNKHAQFVTGTPDFDILYYKENNPDLQHLSLKELCIHFLDEGKREGRDYRQEVFNDVKTLPTESSWDVKTTFTTEHEDWSRAKVCIIYPYYEKDNSTKNQDNLTFFLKYAMNKNLWRRMNVKLLLMINGYQCEVDIPKQNNIFVWRKSYSNESDGRDIGSFRQGIEYLEKKYQQPFYEKFDYLFLLNSSATGPITVSKPDFHWLDPFIDKMEKENSVICSPVINFLKNDDAGGPGPRCQTYCSLIKMNQEVYKCLLFTPISRSPSDTKNFTCADLLPTHACAIDIHKTTADVILFGEYGLTRVLLENGFNISCLIYDNIDYFQKSKWHLYSDRVDRIEDYKDSFFQKTVFIKNNWIVGGLEDAYRDSLPVLFEATNRFIQSSLGWIDIFKWYSKTINYECYGAIPSKGRYKIGKINNNNSLLFGFWTKKEDYIKVFGDSECIVKIPQPLKNNTKVVIYTHHDPDNIIKDYVVQGLKVLILLGYDILFNTTSSGIKNVKLPFSFHVHNNLPKTLSEADIHATMLCKCFLNTRFIKYSNILCVNNLYVLPVHGIDQMEKSMKTARNNSDFWMLYDTRGIVFNNTCMEFSKKCFPFVRFFFTQQINKPNPVDLFKRIEIELPYLLIQKGLRFHGINEYPNFRNFQSILRSSDCFAITLGNLKKFITKTSFTIKNPALRFLLRYLNLDDSNSVLLGNQ
jgi:hypothetical protein